METPDCHDQRLTSLEGRGVTTYLDLEEFSHLQQDGFGIVMLLLTIDASLGRGKTQ